MRCVFSKRKNFQIRDRKNISCVIECPNCVVEKIHLFFLAGETESVFAITNWDTRESFITDLDMFTFYNE